MDLQIYGMRKSYIGCRSLPPATDMVARSFIFHLPSFNRSIFQSFIFPKIQSFNFSSSIRNTIIPKEPASLDI